MIGDFVFYLFAAVIVVSGFCVAFCRNIVHAAFSLLFTLLSVAALFAMLADCRVTGAKTAKTFYNCPGWVLHHNTDLWRGAAPINHSNHGIWPTGGAWLCQHLWTHYEFNPDLAYLAPLRGEDDEVRTVVGRQCLAHELE